MALQKLLVPYSFTPTDEKALDFVIQRYSGENSVDVTLFHAFTPVPEFEVKSDPIMQKMSENLQYLNQQNSYREEKLKEAREKLIQSGFSADRVRHVFAPLKKQVSQEIIDLAVQQGMDFVILTQNRSRVARFFAKSISAKVLQSLGESRVLIVP